MDKSNISLRILQDILQTHLFLMSNKFETQDCQWYAVKRTNESVSSSKRFFLLFLQHRKIANEKKRVFFSI